MKAFSILGVISLMVAHQALAQENRQQMLSDSRAMVRQEWRQDARMIFNIQRATTCGMVDSITGMTAIIIVTDRMKDEQDAAGLIGDPTLDGWTLAKNAVSAVSKTYTPDVCASYVASLSPSYRAELRQAIYGLAALAAP